VGVHTIAIVNQKGGVGKTAITLGIASAIRHRGGKVLVVDMDPQANATTGLGIEVQAETLTVGDAMAAGTPGVAADAIASSSWGDGVSCIPADVHLAEREQETGGKGHEFRLRRSLEGIDGYDLALIDCQPSVGELVTNALVAADFALVVTEADVDSLVGITNVMDTVDAVRQYYNPRLSTAGVVVNNLDLRAGEQKYRLRELQDAYGPLVWEPYLPHRTRIADAKGASAAIHDYGYRAKDVVAIFDTIASRLVDLQKDL
jgi:chromosome partitioning protein